LKRAWNAKVRSAQMATSGKTKTNGKVVKHEEEEHGYEFLGP
jgi:hypothetical protein